MEGIMSGVDPVYYPSEAPEVTGEKVLMIFSGGNGDWYVAVTEPNVYPIKKSVRICTSGGASHSAPGLAVGIARAYRAIVGEVDVITIRRRFGQETPSQLREVRYLTDDVDLVHPHELVIVKISPEEWDVAVVLKGATYQNSYIRITTYSKVPGLFKAIEKAFESIAAALPTTWNGVRHVR
jgi:hypothetical protein